MDSATEILKSTLGLTDEELENIYKQREDASANASKEDMLKLHNLSTKSEPLSDSEKEELTALRIKVSSEPVLPNKVIIHEMILEGDKAQDDTLYEVTFMGAAEDYGYDNQTDYLSDTEAYEIAQEVANETNSEIHWNGYKPSWA